MSVINKVLRDLDKRQGAAAATPVDAAGVRIGTASVTGTEGPGRRAPARPQPRGNAVRIGLSLVVLAVFGGGVLWKTGTLYGRASVQPAPVAVPPAVVATESIAVKPASRFDATLNVSNNMRPAAVAPSQTVPAKVPPPSPPPPPLPAPKLPAPQLPVPAAAPMAEAVAPLAPEASAALAAPAPTVAEVAQKQQLAGRDALSHAQTLWNGGSRDAAVDMLQQAVATAERVVASTPSAANTQTLVLLVREFGRMQLSEGRPAVVWETLTRLEPALRDQPEMWALRANAAQRMGRHQDSVHAYMTALQSRPTEQRWLLGTAVSLAALGQTASAADMADKARAAGPISNEVQTYLRQMGVPIKE